MEQYGPVISQLVMRFARLWDVTMRAFSDSLGRSPVLIMWLKDLQRCGVGTSA